MTIHNNDELRSFEQALEQCAGSVLVVTPKGIQYDLKNPMERYPGISSLLTSDAELFATNRSDEMKLLGFFRDAA